MSSSTAFPRLPTMADVPPYVELTITPPQAGSPLRSALLLLHGLGDTNKPFTALASQLRLPSTVVLSVQAPNPLPAIFTGSEAPSFHWGDDVLFDNNTSDIDLDAGFTTAGKIIWNDIIGGILIAKCGFEVRDIMIMGFGQGGMVGLCVAAAENRVEMGGVISIGGKLPTTELQLPPLPSTTETTASKTGSSPAKCRTPILLLGGSRSTQVTQSAVAAVKAKFSDVEYVKWAKSEDGMPTSREEMLPLMRMFARRLGRMATPSGAVEI